ncbi:hypothetical protein F5B18DRAFT_657483 [Nemania serpens]|nr:hypothetical protein F5B18DRAFT_657483 [Nemania serpens]
MPVRNNALNPDLLNEKRAEIEAPAANPRDWSDSLYEKLYELDSVLVELRRTSPLTTKGLKRLFREPCTFQNGRPQRHICMHVIQAIENDPTRTPYQKVFDGPRQYRLSQQAQKSGLLNTNNKFNSHL